MCCLITNKWYIGIGKDLAKRLLDYTDYETASIGPVIKSALRKYKPENFLIVPLFYQLLYDRKVLVAVEAALIQAFAAVSNGYNIILSSENSPKYGENFLRIVKMLHTQPHVRANHSRAAREAYNKPGHREKHRNGILVAIHKQDVKERHKQASSIANAKQEKRHAIGKAVHAFYKEHPYIWITNGTENKKFFTEIIPNGWYRGHTKKTKPSGRPRKK